VVVTIHSHSNFLSRLINSNSVLSLDIREALEAESQAVVLVENIVQGLLTLIRLVLEVDGSVLWRVRVLEGDVGEISFTFECDKLSQEFLVLGDILGHLRAFGEIIVVAWCIAIGTRVEADLRGVVVGQTSRTVLERGPLRLFAKVSHKIGVVKLRL
jgi:hypothetical protein